MSVSVFISLHECILLMHIGLDIYYVMYIYHTLFSIL